MMISFLEGIELALRKRRPGPQALCSPDRCLYWAHGRKHFYPSVNPTA
jgi:hypothetical protein